ncbi:MAG: peptidase C39 family protein [Deltaproteobacteria bacterium]|nr:peptidase C39 family protein [Deltaproteobacteria bacterium]MBW1796044.1 peptidase C39 family protein [Deltaproteobacteria bacterium]
MWVRRCLHIFSFVLPILFSCAGAPDVKESRTSQIIESVPFYPQEAYQCGPASLAGVLNYWQTGVSPEDIAGEIYSESAKGTLDIDMISYAERKGLKAMQYKGSVEDIKRNIDSGYPVIVLVDYGFWVYQQNHFMVVIGYNENGILANSGRDRLKFIPFRDFLKLWKRTDFWTMLINPKQ